MMSIVRAVLATTLVALLAVTIQAQEKKPVKKDAYAKEFAYPKQIKLDDKQKEQVDKLLAEFSPKLASSDKKKNEILTKERVKKATAARKKAYDEIVSPDRVKAAKEAQKDKKGKEAKKAYDESLKLTEDEQKKIKGLNKVYDEGLALTADEKRDLTTINTERGKLIKDIAEKKMAILTDEQKALLKKKK